MKLNKSFTVNEYIKLSNSNTGMRSICLFTLYLFLISGCKSTKKTINMVPSEEATLLISMKKTACYGSCPVYEIQIFSDLTVILNGERYLDKVGNFFSTLPEKRLEELRSRFIEADFFSFQDKYTERITDLPTTYVYFNDSGNEKKVMDYSGAPDALKNIENDIASLLDELKWSKVEQKEE